MPSFLSKVFGRKKDDKDALSTSPRLLEGKFERVSPTVSPSATNFPEVGEGTVNGKSNGHRKDKDKDTPFTLFRAKSRPSGDVNQQQNQHKSEPLPQLSLNLPEVKEGSVAFEANPDAQVLLSDAVVGTRRLNPAETLTLVRTCSEAITARGLETLGIMHPHWYSTSPDIQRRLISLFIHSLSTAPGSSTLPSPSPFESELDSTRSPQDIAAVLRWGLRHLQLSTSSFGTSSNWYTSFFEAERAASYSPTAFTDSLIPLIPKQNQELLLATLEIVSSLAARSESNGTSGSKLAKLFGLWLLAAHPVEDGDDWTTFYQRWERTGRQFEHLLLARIRDEASRQRMPNRLLELVKAYPFYPKDDLAPADGILPRPNRSTRRYEALFVRIETEVPSSKGKEKEGKNKAHPLALIAAAFASSPAENAGPHNDLWERIRAASASGETSASSELSRVFADETIRFLSLAPGSKATATQSPTSPTFSLLPAESNKFLADKRQRPVSTSDQPKYGSANGQSPSKATIDSSPLSSAVTPSTGASIIGTDWAQFSTSGFWDTPAPLASTLLDSDIEVTQPVSATSSRRPTKRTKVGGRKSIEVPRTSISELLEENGSTTKDVPQSISRTAVVSVVELDEAFIDFWSDALLDPIANEWPSFVVCKLKGSAPALSGLTLPGEESQEPKKLEWLVLEQAYTTPPPSPALATPTAEEAQRRPRPSSPKPSFASETKKRFSFFTGSSSRQHSSQSIASVKNKSKSSKAPRVGEMGEILQEEGEQETPKTTKKKDDNTVRVKIPVPKSKKSLGDVQGKKEEKEEKLPELVATGAGKKVEVEQDKVSEAPKEAKAETKDEGVSDAAVAAVATSVVAAGAAAVLATTVDTTSETKPESEAQVPETEPIIMTETNDTTVAEPAEVEFLNGKADEKPLVEADDAPTREVLTAIPEVASPEIQASEPAKEEAASAPVGSTSERIEADISPVEEPVVVKEFTAPLVDSAPESFEAVAHPPNESAVAKEPAAAAQHIEPVAIQENTPAPEIVEPIATIESTASKEPSTGSPAQEAVVDAPTEAEAPPDTMVEPLSPPDEPSKHVEDSALPAAEDPVFSAIQVPSPTIATAEAPLPAPTTDAPQVVAEVDVSPSPTDLAGPTSIEVLSPTPGVNDVGDFIREEQHLTTSRAPGPDAAVEEVLLAEDAPLADPSATLAPGPKSTETPSTELIPAIEDLKLEDVASNGSAHSVHEPTVAVPEIPIETVSVEEPLAPSAVEGSPAESEGINVISVIPHIERLPVDGDASTSDVSLPEVPIVEAEPVIPEASPETHVTIPLAAESGTKDVDEAAVTGSAGAIASKEDLPAAPESVVASGSTPGPEIALSTSEPNDHTGVANISDVVADTPNELVEEVPVPQNGHQHLEETSNPGNPVGKTVATDDTSVNANILDTETSEPIDTKPTPSADVQD
ncbi:hypothetical protein BDQ12DRAFT_667228 [Crucibulum laeve]|uniref:Meiotically up-regulated protein Msb1/Mug8 domain-containing protein n=1 Tax=Crucibulum laeve TaxID=68775 RepID=A0A5C3LX75_9AGAR|nr:hypothetical protein BDQ12DRAFT_667228 [Crucibulum laeve]